jgi:DNA-binding GntR family transcriptional regulator
MRRLWRCQVPNRRIKLVERAPALDDQVYNLLRARLRSGAIGAGQALQEVQLAEQFGVSRTPVRVAMARLASEGLLANHGRSFSVPALTLQDVDDIYELRCLVEPEALRRIAPLLADAALRAPLEAALAGAQAAYRAADAAAFRSANVRYRAAWLALVANARLVRVVELYADHLQHIRALTLGDPRVRTIVLRGLERITAALAAGDGDAAAAAMHEHLMQARCAFIEATGLDDKPRAGNKPVHQRRAGGGNGSVQRSSQGGSATLPDQHEGRPARAGLGALGTTTA